MIIDFTVSNYRSLKDSVTLSFVAQKNRATKNGGTTTKSFDESICAGYQVEGRGFKLLPVAAIFGANASGKSNVIRALGLLIGCMSFRTEGRYSLLNSISPFALGEKKLDEPTCFNLRFVEDGAIFAFELQIVKGLVIKEQLDYSPPPVLRQSTRLLYKRELDRHSGTYQTESGASFAGPHIQLLATVEKNALYFPLFSRLKAPLVAPLVQWLSMSGMGVFDGDEENDFNYAAGAFFAYPNDKRLALEILQQFDTGLHDFEVSQEEGNGGDYHVQAVHKVSKQLVRWDFEEESLGTQRLFGLLGAILGSLQLKHALIVDEFGANFHPKITRALIDLFHERRADEKGAQLIFTSHDNTLWKEHLRRDEIWLTDKQDDNSTTLTPLSAFKPRNDLALEKAYMDGRFGGVPYVGDIEEVLATAEERKELVDVN